MKKILALLISICIVCSLCACGKTGNQSTAETPSDSVHTADRAMSSVHTSGVPSDNSAHSDHSSASSDISGNKESGESHAASVISSNASSQSSDALRAVGDNVKVLKVYDAKIPSLDGDFSYQYFHDDYVSGKAMPYRLYVPAKREKSGKCPVILFLHGAGEIGSDNQRHLSNFVQGFEKAGDILGKAIIVCPQTPSGWSVDEYEPYDQKGYLGISKRIVDYVIKQYGGDRNRVYLTGLSLGGFAVWDMLNYYPGFFAAAVSVCGGVGYYASEAMINTPIWIYHGTDDSTVPYSSSYDTYNAILNAGGDRVRFTSLPGVNHNAWDYAYTDRNMFSWMFSQNLKTHQSADYDYMNILEISKGNETVITEQDVECAFYMFDLDTEYIELYLTSIASNRLNDEYAGNKETVYTFKFGGENVYEFKLTAAPEDRILRIEKTVADSDFDIIRKYVSAH